jgi:deoxyribonuclease V
MISPLNEWLYPASPAEARAVQSLLAARVVAEDEAVGDETVRVVAGLDCSYVREEAGERVVAAAVLVAVPGLRVTATVGATRPAAMPYVPGLLAFREAPALLDAFGRLPEAPDLVLVDGHGISHPRGLGVASHVGVLLDVPTIGVAKSILVGKVEGELGEMPGSQVPLVWRGRVIATVLRTRRRVQPVYVSVGHRVSLAGAVRHVMALLGGYRLPEPTRQADRAAAVLKREPDLFGAIQPSGARG